MTNHPRRRPDGVCGRLWSVLPRRLSAGLRRLRATSIALLALYDIRRKAGDKPGAALKEALSVVLSSPMFLYLAEPTAR